MYEPDLLQIFDCLLDGYGSVNKERVIFFYHLKLVYKNLVDIFSIRGFQHRQ